MKHLIRKVACSAITVCMLSFAGNVTAKPENYKIDVKGAHAFVQFRIKHLGYSWLYGHFDEFDGSFIYDAENPENNAITVDVNVASIDSNHAERDKHLRGKKFMNVDKFETAKFVSTSYKKTGERTGELTGPLTLFGETHDITIDVEHIGGGKDPWGGYRQGFEGRATIKPAKWGNDLTKRLGEGAAEVELMLTVEGIRQ